MPKDNRCDCDFLICSCYTQEVNPSILHVCGHVAPQARWRMPLHAHEHQHELILVLGGRIKTQIAARTIVGGKGDAMFYPRGQAHQEQAVGSERLETYFVSWTPGDDVSTEGWNLQTFDSQGRLRQALEWMLELLPAPSRDGCSIAADRVVGDQMLRCLLRLLLGEYGRLQAAAPGEILQQVRRFVQANIAGKITLDDLAGVAGLSRFHFARVFAATAGLSPMQFVRSCRVEAARRLLVTTPLALKAIARQVGFADEYHLSRVFRHVTGQNPSHLRGRGRG